jgi:hypothetical protein
MIPSDVNGKYSLMKLVRAAVGGETVQRIYHGDTGVISSLEMQVIPQVWRPGLIHFKIPINYQRAFGELERCGKMPQDIRESYVNSWRDRENTYMNRGIVDVEDITEIMTMGNPHFSTFDEIRRAVALPIGEIEFMRYNPDGHDKFLELMGLGTDEDVKSKTLNNPVWLKAASKYTGWLFDYIKNEKKVDLAPIAEDIERISGLYSGVWQLD